MSPIVSSIANAVNKTGGYEGNLGFVTNGAILLTKLPFLWLSAAEEEQICLIKYFRRYAPI